jgi:hypothetical protein
MPARSPLRGLTPRKGRHQHTRNAESGPGHAKRPQRKALVRWRDDRTDPSSANAQPTRTRMRLRPRLLVQAYRPRACREVVVPGPLRRSPSQESRPRRMEANSWPRSGRGVETATARGMSPSATASALAGARGALLPDAGGRASSAERPDRRQVVSPGDARVRLPRAC